jgi:hypothetical protein
MSRFRKQHEPSASAKDSALSALPSIDSVASYFAKHYEMELRTILAHPDAQRHFGVDLNMIDLAHHLTSVAVALYHQPKPMLVFLDEALRLAEEKIFRENEGQEMEVKVVMSQMM